MNPEVRIYVAGHRGMVGSALVRNLAARGYKNIITRTHAELDLTRQADVEAFFAAERPEYVFIAAAKVGGVAHVVLPSREFSTDHSNPVKFADSAVPFLIDEMERAGADRNRMQARLVGGASMFSALIPANAETMGQRNLKRCREVLAEVSVPIVGEEVGEHRGRSAVLDVATGTVTVRSVGQGEQVV